MHKTIREKSLGTWGSNDGAIKLSILAVVSEEPTTRKRVNLEIDNEALIVDALLDSYWVGDKYRLGNHMPYYIKDANDSTLVFGIDNSGVFELTRGV